jgi:NADH-quinone oxidoreductase subunit F
VKNPGVYEIELGLSVYEFMNSDEYLGGMSSDRPLKALVPGGSSVPILPADLIYKTANGEDRLIHMNLSDGGFATGSMLGSEVSLYNDTCIVRNTWNFARFYHHESCGQCLHVEGTGWLESTTPNRKRSRT